MFTVPSGEVIVEERGVPVPDDWSMAPDEDRVRFSLSGVTPHCKTYKSKMHDAMDTTGSVEGIFSSILPMIASILMTVNQVLNIKIDLNSILFPISFENQSGYILTYVVIRINTNTPPAGPLAAYGDRHLIHCSISHPPPQEAQRNSGK